jgi:hypothetical protein
MKDIPLLIFLFLLVLTIASVRSILHSFHTLGSKFAMQEAVIILSTLMQHYTIELHPESKVYPVFEAINAPKGLLARFVERRK